MATPYSEIREYVKSFLIGTILSDFFASPNSDESINLNIRTTNLSHGFPLETDGFVDTLTDQQKLIISIKTALRFASSLPNEFSYKSPVTNATRKGMRDWLVMYLQDELNKAENLDGGSFACDVMTGIQAIMRSEEIFCTDVSGAL